MAAAPVEETVSRDKPDCKLSVANLIKELRTVSTDSLRELDEVNQYLEKLAGKDDATWTTEINDPIMTFDLENLRQAFRETITLSGKYKDACENLEHYLLKLSEEHAGEAQAPSRSAKLSVNKVVTTQRGEILLDYVTRGIAHCCTHVDEYGSKFNDLNAHISEILDKYCIPVLICTHRSA